MANIFEVGEVILAAQQQADMENSDFISQPEWKRYLHSVWGEHYSELVGSGMRYYEKNLSFTGADLKDDGFGGGTLDLPRDYFVHAFVDRAEGNRWVGLFELMSQERNWLTGSSNSKPVAYAVIAQKLHIYPKPPDSASMKFVYVPQPKRLRFADDNEEIDVVTTDGEEFIVWAMVVKALMKEGTNPNHAMGERDRFLKRLQEWAHERSLHTPRRRQVAQDPMANVFGNTHQDEGNYRY